MYRKGGGVTNLGQNPEKSLGRVPSAPSLANYKPRSWPNLTLHAPQHCYLVPRIRPQQRSETVCNISFGQYSLNARDSLFKTSSVATPTQRQGNCSNDSRAFSDGVGREAPLLSKDVNPLIRVGGAPAWPERKEMCLNAKQDFEFLSDLPVDSSDKSKWDLLAMEPP